MNVLLYVDKCKKVWKNTALLRKQTTFKKWIVFLIKCKKVCKNYPPNIST